MTPVSMNANWFWIKRDEKQHKSNYWFVVRQPFPRLKSPPLRRPKAIRHNWNALPKATRVLPSIGNAKMTNYCRKVNTRWPASTIESMKWPEKIEAYTIAWPITVSVYRPSGAWILKLNSGHRFRCHGQRWLKHWTTTLSWSVVLKRTPRRRLSGTEENRKFSMIQITGKKKKKKMKKRPKCFLLGKFRLIFPRSFYDFQHFNYGHRKRSHYIGFACYYGRAMAVRRLSMQS